MTVSQTQFNQINLANSSVADYFFLTEENRVKTFDFLESLVITNSVIKSRVFSESSSQNQLREFDDDIKKLAVFNAVFFSYNSNSPELSSGESKLLAIFGYNKKLLEAEKIIEESGEAMTPLAFAIKLKNLNAVKLLIKFGVDAENPSVKKQIKNLLTEENLLPNQREISKSICNIFLISGIRIDLDPTIEVSMGFEVTKKNFLKVQQLFDNLKNQQILLNKENAKEVFLDALKEFNSYDGENRVRNQSSIFDLSADVRIKDQHGIDQDFKVGILFLNKLLDEAIVKKPICLDYCGIFARLSNYESVKEFLAKDRDTKDELAKFLSNLEISKQFEDIVRKSISESRPSTSNSMRHSRENHLSDELRIFSRQGSSSGISQISRDDIFTSLEERPNIQRYKEDNTLWERSANSTRDGNSDNETTGLVEIQGKEIMVPPPNPESPSVLAMQAPLRKRFS